MILPAVGMRVVCLAGKDGDEERCSHTVTAIVTADTFQCDDTPGLIFKLKNFNQSYGWKFLEAKENELVSFIKQDVTPVEEPGQGALCNNATCPIVNFGVQHTCGKE